MFQDDSLAKLNRMHKQQEMDIWEVFEGISKSIEKLDDAIGFAETVVNRGNTTEVRVIIILSLDHRPIKY